MPREDGSVKIKVNMDIGNVQTGIEDIKAGCKRAGAAVERTGKTMGKAMEGALEGVSSKRGAAELMESYSAALEGSAEAAGKLVEMAKRAGVSVVNLHGFINKLAGAAEIVTEAADDIRVDDDGTAETFSQQLTTAKERLDALTEQGKGLGDQDWETAYTAYHQLLALEKSRLAELRKTDEQWQREEEIAARVEARMEEIRQKEEAKAEAARQAEAAEQAEAQRLEEIAKNAKVADQQIVAMAQELEQLQARRADLSAAGVGVGYEEYDQIESKIAQINQQLSEYQNKVQSIGSGGLVSVLKSGLTGVLGIVKRIGSAIGSVFKGAWNLAKTVAGKLLSAFKSVLSTVKKLIIGNRDLSNSVGGIASSIKKLVPALMAARGVMGILRKAVNAFLEANTAVTNQLNAAWINLGNILGPIITQIVNLVSTAIAYVTSFLKLLGLTASASVDAIESAGGAAGSAAKALKHQLSGLDELHTWQSESSGGGGGGGSGANNAGAALPEVELPDWAKLVAEALRSGRWEEAARVLSKSLNDMVDGVDWEGLGKRFGEKMAGVLKFIATFIRKFDFVDLFTGIFTLLKNAIEKLDAYDLGTLLATKFILIVSALEGALDSGIFNTVTEKVIGAIGGFFETVREKFATESEPNGWTHIGAVFGDAIIQIVDTIGALLRGEGWGEIGGDLRAFWDGLYTALTSEEAKTAWDGLGQSIRRTIANLASVIAGWLPNKSEFGKTYWWELQTRITDGDNISWIDVFQALTTLLGDLATTLAEYISSKGWKEWWENLKDRIAQAMGASDWEDLKTQIRTKVLDVLKEALSEAAEMCYDALKEEHPNWASILFPGQAAIDQAEGEFEAALENGMDYAGKVLQWWEGFKGVPESAIKEIAESHGYYYSDGILSSAPIVETAGAAVVDTLIDAYRNGELEMETLGGDGTAAYILGMEGSEQNLIEAADTHAALILNAFDGCKEFLFADAEEGMANYLNGLMARTDMTLEEAAEIAQAVAAAMAEEAPEYAEAAKAVADAYIGALELKQGEAAEAGEALGNASAGAAAGVETSLDDMQSAAEDIAGTVPTEIEDQQGAARTAGFGVGREATAGITKALEDYADAVKDGVDGGAAAAGTGAQVMRDRVHNQTRMMKQDTVSDVEEMSSGVSDAVSEMGTDTEAGLTAAKNTVLDIFAAIGAGIQTKLQAARDAVSSIISQIRSMFNFSWSLPNLKLPHISISGGFSLDPLSVPQFSVSWYAKGGIVDGATLIGAGEAGKEAIIPLERHTEWIDKVAARIAGLLGGGALSKELSDIAQRLGEIPAALDRLGLAVANVPMPVMASGTVIPPKTLYVDGLVQGLGAMGGTYAEESEERAQEMSEVIGLLRQLVAGVSKNQAQGNTTYEFNAKLNGETLFREVITQGKAKRTQTGRNPFDM